MPALLIKLPSVLLGSPTSLPVPLSCLFSLPAHRGGQLYTSHAQPPNTSQQTCTTLREGQTLSRGNETNSSVGEGKHCAVGVMEAPGGGPSLLGSL